MNPPPPRPLLRSPWFLGALLLAIAVWTIDVGVLRAGPPHPLDDTWEDAIVARQLLEGHGYRTHMIFPALWSYRDPASLTLPVLVHGPLVPLVLLPALALGGPGAIDRVAWIAALFALLTVIPLFRLAARRFGEPVAAAAAALFTLSPLAIAAVDHYLTVVVGAFLLTVSLDLLARDRPRTVVAGAVAGLCYLARPEMLLGAPVLAWLAATPGGTAPARTGGAGAAARFLAAFALIAAPWWFERWRATGSPFFNLSSYLVVLYSPAFPGDGLVRDFASPPARFPALLAEALPGLWQKWLHLFPRAVKRALTTPNAAIGWLVPIGALGMLARSDLRRVAIAFLLLALLPIAAITLLAPERLYPVPYLPLYCIAAACGARAVFSRLPRWAHRPRAWIGALALVSLPAAGIELQEQRREARRIETWLARDRAGLTVAARTAENATRPMFSDTPDFVAWTTGRPTVWLQRLEFERLYGISAAPRAGLPARPAPSDTWYHARDPIDSEGQAGAPIAAPSPAVSPPRTRPIPAEPRAPRRAP